MSDDTATDQLRRAMPLTATLGIRAVTFTAETVALSLDWSPLLCTSNGLLHGGMIMALADSAGGACAFLNLPAGATGTSTIESATRFLGTVTEGTITATATPLHKGRSTIVVDTAVRDHRDRLVARTTQTQTVLTPRPPAG